MQKSKGLNPSPCFIPMSGLNGGVIPSGSFKLCSEQPMSKISQVRSKLAEIVNRGYSWSGVRICYTPVFIDKINFEWEKPQDPSRLSVFGISMK